MKEEFLRGNIMTKDSTNEQDIDRYVVHIQENKDGELYITFPRELMSKLGWMIGDDIKWNETEICEDWGEHKGFTLSNKSKLFRDADEARRMAISIHME
jgi:hypothetical protein